MSIIVLPFCNIYICITPVLLQWLVPSEKVVYYGISGLEVILILILVIQGFHGKLSCPLHNQYISNTIYHLVFADYSNF